MSDSIFSLKGKNALVTGGGGSIGGAIACHLAQAGAQTIVADQHLEAAESVVQQIHAQGSVSQAMRVNLADERSIETLFTEFQAKVGPLHILVASAGLSEKGDIFSTSLVEWHSIIDVNLTSSFLCAKHAAGIMRSQKQGGRIIFVGSPVAFRGGVRGHVAYAASKGGLLAMAKTLARTLAADQITVNVLTPGLTDTPLARKTNTKEVVDKMGAKIPLGLALPANIAAGAIFLASDAAAHATGISLDIEGGDVMR